MPKKIEAHAYDVRTIERHIRVGLVSRKDYDKYLGTIEDSAAHAVESDVRMTFDVARRRGDDGHTVTTAETSEED
jgi:hypothetical protein